MFSFPEQYSGTKESIKVTTEFLQEVSTKSGRNIDNGSTVCDIMDKELLRNCDHFLSDLIEIASNEGIETYRFLENKSRILDLSIFFI